jgi:hypothetical protein
MDDTEHLKKLALARDRVADAELADSSPEDMAAGILRVLITGSREWQDNELIYVVLDELAETAYQFRMKLKLVHGGARGVDTIAHEWALKKARRDAGVMEPERHYAKWVEPCHPERCKPGHRQPGYRDIDTCPAAGIYRNEHMVDLGAVLCVAFQHQDSRGTGHCVSYARRKGIPVLLFEE